MKILTRSQKTTDDAREDDADGPLDGVDGRTPVAFLLVLTGFGVSTLPGLLLAFDLFLMDENRQGRRAEVWMLVGCEDSCVVNYCWIWSIRGLLMSPWREEDSRYLVWWSCRCWLCGTCWSYVRSRRLLLCSGFRDGRAWKDVEVV